MIYFIDRYDFNKDFQVRNFSGYEQIVKYSSEFKRINSVIFLNKVLHLLLKNKIPKNYIKSNLSKELIAFYYAFVWGIPIFYLYADKDAYLLPLLKRKFQMNRIKIYGTLHWPKEISTNFSFYHYQLMDQFDGVFSLSKTLSEDNKQIKIIPHGINLEFWTNLNLNLFENYYLVIGQSNRNHYKQIEVITKISKIDSNANFIVVVSNNKVKDFYKEIPKTTVINTRISDIELHDLYAKAKGVILFQDYCLASNVVLESIAMGVPILTNNVGDISEYLGKDYELYINNLDNDIYKLKKFIENKDVRESIVSKFVKIKNKFDWKIISSVTVNYIKQN